MKSNSQLFYIDFKVLIILLSSLFTTSVAVSQSYNTAAGIRIGSDFGITVAQRIAKRNTVELIYEDGLFEGNRNIDLLLKHHLPLISKSFNFYTGLGIGYASGFNAGSDLRVGSLSVPAMLGAEITLGRFNIGADFQPTLLFKKIDDQRLVRSSGVSLRYVLIKRKKNKNKTKKKVNNFFDELFNKNKSNKR